MEELQHQTTDLKLYMLLLGCKAPGRHVEQHDFFFGIGTTLKSLIPQIKAFWPEAISSLHIDAWREVSQVDGYAIKIALKNGSNNADGADKLFFINLGGYKANQFEEQHYVMLTVKADKAQAIRDAKKTTFFKTNSLADVKSANAHIDDQYGIDVDDIYRIEEMLSVHDKAKFVIEITPSPLALPDDDIHLGYFRLDKL